MFTRENSLFVKLLFGCLLLSFPNAVLGNSFRFPHYVVGGGYTTQIVVTNFSQNTAAGRMVFYDRYGSPQILTFDSEQTSSVNLTLPPGASKVMITKSTGADMLMGYATVETDQEAVLGAVMFKYMNGAEVGVQHIFPGKRFSLIVEKTATTDSGVAVALESPAQPITLKLYDNQGILRSTRTWNPGSGVKQDAKYLSELFSIVDFQGALVLESTGFFTCFGLRLGILTYSMTSIPVFDSRMRIDPTVKITTPTAKPTFATNSNTINIGGTVIDANTVTSVAYSNDRGGSGVASGTTNWSVSNLTLQAGTNVITVTATDAAGHMGMATLTVTYTPAPPPPTITLISASCSPTLIQSGQTSQCTATVQGTGNYSSAVTWSATPGTISTSGLFTAPSVTTTTTATITATSVQDTSKSASALVMVNPVPSTITKVTVSCASTSLKSEQTSQCTATVQGTGNYSSAVTWSATLGTISTSGLFTAPSVTTATTVAITATSVQDTSKSGTASVTVTPLTTFVSCPSGGPSPVVTLNPPAAGASTISGTACNIDPAVDKIVFYALTNQWYVQPYVAWPFTDIKSDGKWSSSTHAWDRLVILLVNPAVYKPEATKITNPALDPNVLAWTMYPQGQVLVNFSNYTWGVKITGTKTSSYRFDPGPNYWSDDPSVVSVQNDGLHLKISKINGLWQCGEVHLLNSLGYGTYTVRVKSRLDNLNVKTVAAPLFIYASTSQELDNEYSGAGGLIPSPNNAQFVVQPYTVSGNMVRYLQPATNQFTSQIEWRADHVTFTTWNGWAPSPTTSTLIKQWTYKGVHIPKVGNERVRINLWLLGGAAPTSGIGDEMIISSFTFQP